MAQRTVVTLTDDLDGTEAAETVTFTLDGVSYEMDLNEKNAEKFRTAMGKYAGAARKVGNAPKGKRGTTTRSSSNSDLDLSKVREWAKDNGHTVSERGRIAGPVLEAYRAAH